MAYITRSAKTFQSRCLRFLCLQVRAQPLVDLLENPEENKEKIESITIAMKKRMEDYFKDYDAATDQKVVGTLLKLYADKTANSIILLSFPQFRKNTKAIFQNMLKNFLKIRCSTARKS
jgi:hypothetical protein